MPGFVVDGQDVLAVYDVVSTAVTRARSGNGPTLVEAKTYRYCDHMEDEPLVPPYRSKDEVVSWTARDPIQLFADVLCGNGIMSAEELHAVRAEVREEVAAAVAFARSSPAPQPEMLFEDLLA